MIRFREFLQQATGNEEQTDIKKMLGKIPPSHANLVQGFQWKFHGGNTLNGDSQHVGYMDAGEKEIAVAAPWNYGREFTVLHEIAHKVWDQLPNQLKQQWMKLSTQMTDGQRKDASLKQEPVELFCMSYAQFYAKTKLTKFDNPQWMNFIASLPS